MSAPLLRVEDLRTWFPTEGGEVRAVDGVDFDVREGEAVGIVGESGCGKTVAALSLLGLVPEPGRIVEGSSIRLRGEELVGASADRLRRVRGAEVAMVFQEPATSLNPVLPVGEQVAEVLRWHRGLGARAARERAVELLAEVGVPDAPERAGAYPHHLSGGMRQRVMLAAALAGEPALLVADEPTTALDVTVQARILELLADLRRRHGMALLLISHDLAVVGQVCERVLVMYAGEIVETGPARDVLRSPTHPYTRGLLGSLPRIDAPGERLHPIAGAVPDPAAWPPACRFADRCPHVWSRCRTRHPPPLPLTSGNGREMPDEAGGTGGEMRDEAGGNGGEMRDEAGETGGDERSARCWLVEEPHRREGAA